MSLRLQIYKEKYWYTNLWTTNLWTNFQQATLIHSLREKKLIWKTCYHNSIVTTNDFLSKCVCFSVEICNFAARKRNFFEKNKISK